MKEVNRDSREIEFYPSKVRFWAIFIMGFICVFLGFKLYNMNLNSRILGETSSNGFLIGGGSVVLIALIIEMMSLPGKMRLVNLKKYLIMFCIYFIVLLGIKKLEIEIFIKIFVTFSIIFGIIMICYSLYRVIIKRPSIILSHEGIILNSECNYYGIRIIYWDEIEDVFVYNNYFKRALCIKVFNMKDLKKRQSIIGKIYSFASGHISILLGFLEGDKEYMEREFIRYFEEYKN